MRKNSRIIGLTLILVLVPAIAMAGQGSPRAHDGGFMIRMAGGFGVGSSKIAGTPDTPKLKLSGDQVDVEIAIGGIVRENLALHGTLFGFAMSDPDAELDDLEGDLAGTFTMSGVGGGLTWWIMPANFYVSGTAGLARVSFDPDGGSSSSSDTGFGMQLCLGKEWWVGESWGLGIAGGFTIHSVPDGEVDENWTGVSFSLRFSATYN